MPNKVQKLGIFGLIVVLIVGAILLPMAKAEKQKTEVRSQKTEFAATLPNGVTVELVGVCEFSGGKVQSCWKPDGTKLDEQIYIKYRPYPHKTFGFVFNTKQSSEITKCEATGTSDRLGTAAVVDANDQLTELAKNHQQHVKLFRIDDLDSTDIKLFVAPIWERKLRHDGKYVIGRHDPKIKFIETYETAGGVKVVFRNDYTGYLYKLQALLSDEAAERLWQIVQRGRRDKFRIDAEFGTVYSEGEKQASAFFKKLELTDVKYFEFFTRPNVEKVTFGNVSLKPNFKTDVQVEGEVNSPGIEIRKVFLPNVEKEAVALDLATGELIKISCEGEIDFQNESFVKALRNLKQGDLICRDGGFVCPQGARVKGSRHFDYDIAFQIYIIPRYLPYMTIVTTGQGRRYNLNVLEGSRGGYLLAYSQISSDIKRSPEPFLFEQLVSDKEFELAASANKLHRLCKVMLIYASGHDEKYPENLQLLTEAEASESEIQWLRENIVYLGNKASPIGSPQAVLAYDKSILEDENNKGTNVLYNDCHVLYEKAEKLKKLGIAPKLKPDAQVEVEGVSKVSEADKMASEKQAVEAASAWLELIDDGDYEESWEQAAGFLKKAVGKEQFRQSVEPVRKPLGKVTSRKVKSKTYTRQVPGALDGEYVVIQFETAFENKKAAIETVTPMLDKDGVWRVSGYYIK